MSEQMTHEQFVEKYGDILSNGLNSHMTYIILTRDDARGIHLAIRPYVYRTGGTLFVGGKLRVGCNGYYSVKQTKKPLESIGDKGKMMRRAFGGIGTWASTSQHRCSVMYGEVIAAGVHDGAAFAEQHPSAKLASDLLASLEKIGNGWKVTNKRKVTNALRDAFDAALQHAFQPMPVNSAGDKVGQTTGFGAMTVKSHTEKADNLLKAVSG